MTDLVDAYQRDEIHTYESILQNNKKDFSSDPFIAEHIDEVTRNMRMKALLRLIAPYTRFTLAFIAKQLKVPISEVQEILSFLIVDKKVRGKIDLENGTVEVESKTDIDRVEAMSQWSSAIGDLYKTIFSEGDGYRAEDINSLGVGGLRSSMAGPRDPNVGFSSGKGGRGRVGGALGKGKGNAGKTPGAGFK
jgi:COP9 signalosome complex subunit 2